MRDMDDVEALNGVLTPPWQPFTIAQLAVEKVGGVVGAPGCVECVMCVLSWHGGPHKRVCVGGGGERGRLKSGLVCECVCAGSVCAGSVC